LTLINEGICRPPTFLKIDAEGAEENILRSFGSHLRNPNLCVVVSTDSKQLHLACTAILEDAGLQVIDSGKLTHPEPWHKFGDVELFAFGSSRLPDEDLIRQVRSIGQKR
jgi:hypothetical protein